MDTDKIESFVMLALRIAAEKFRDIARDPAAGAEDFPLDDKARAWLVQKFELQEKEALELITAIGERGLVDVATAFPFVVRGFDCNGGTVYIAADGELTLDVNEAASVPHAFAHALARGAGYPPTVKYLAAITRGEALKEDSKQRASAQGKVTHHGIQS